VTTDAVPSRSHGVVNPSHGAKKIRWRKWQLISTHQLRSTPNAWRSGAVGWSAWLGVSFIAEWLVHSEPAKVGTSTFDAFLCVDFEAVAVEEGPSAKTGVGRDSWNPECTQRRLDALVEAGRNTTTGKSRMSEDKVEVTVACVGNETRKNAVTLSNDGVKMRKSLLPACGVGWNWCPRGNLVR
jgi:hypothetical protein